MEACIKQGAANLAVQRIGSGNNHAVQVAIRHLCHRHETATSEVASNVRRAFGMGINDATQHDPILAFTARAWLKPITPTPTTPTFKTPALIGLLR
jgi:hypothetical protein